MSEIQDQSRSSQDPYVLVPLSRAIMPLISRGHLNIQGRRVSFDGNIVQKAVECLEKNSVDAYVRLSGEDAIRANIDVPSADPLSRSTFETACFQTQSGIVAHAARHFGVYGDSSDPISIRDMSVGSSR